MKLLNRILAVAVFLILLMILQAQRIFSFGGINPNLLLLGLLPLVFFMRNIWQLVLLFLIVFLATLFWWPFWLVQVLVLFFLVLLIFFVKKILTGRPLLDFLLALFVVTILFYFLNHLLNLTKFSFNFILGEMFFNFFLGLISWWLIKKLVSA